MKIYPFYVFDITENEDTLKQVQQLQVLYNFCTFGVK